MIAWAFTVAAIIVALAACAVAGLVISLHWFGGCDSSLPGSCAELGQCTRQITSHRADREGARRRG